ncbi:alpha/beta hydrolase [Bordetella bronchiseptica]|uniref:alpha/beta hydrolase n=1 Tax=Bordetella bronchiseptica TaxID=518 RepID=UPI000444DB62|nr:alpha/beta hydrolase [Bordetella bronchiseptica]AWP82963.1 acetylesterase [Bordetella bronchiseptica]AWQ08530.1 acetylesterase [Bordetella bronchiseptica]AXT91086.1 alpha/beta hydrolase [Bordetella bronchiseptica]KDB83756.1 putative acetyl esterase [Bordetella bronchiseptica CARE970018BB]KDC95340.1 putative acetyl esterase [Bordetella bronchiseptica MBORD670]
MTTAALPYPLDPQIQRFVERMQADSAAHPRRDLVPVEQARAISEAVRRPWAEGGPQMARTREIHAPTPHGPVRLRVYTPRAARPGPALLYVHGGGWVLFSLDTHDRLMREYAERAGLTVIGVDYTRAPEARYPRAIEEIVGVIDWLDANGAELEVDRARLCIGGDSAGANLSVAACLTLRERGAASLAGMVLNYGVYDANLFRDSTVKYGGGEYLLSTQQMVWFYWNYLRAGDDPRDPRISPVHADLRGLPPAFMAITELDLLHDANQDMAARLREAGVDVQAKVYPGTVHSFLEAVSLAQVSVAAFDDTAAWLRAVLRPAAAAAAIHTGEHQP